MEEYIERNNQTYYAKPKTEFVTYRNLMLRKSNIKNLMNLIKRHESHLQD